MQTIELHKVKQKQCIHPSEFVDNLSLGDLKGVNVLFINMPLRETAIPNTPPQGPGLMAARLRQYGASPTIIDLNAYRIKDEHALAKNLPNGRHLTLSETEGLLRAHFHKHGEPHMVALSGMITTLRWQSEVATMVKKLIPDTFLVTGGGLATEVKAGLFQWIPQMDAIAHSEGDDIILLMARDVKLKNTRGMEAACASPFYLGEIEGKQRFLYGGDRPTNLDILPYAAWDLLEEDALGNPVLEWYIKQPVWGLAANNSSAAPFTMKRSLTTVSSRGCPYACAFCYRGAQGERNYGMRGVKNLADEVRWLVNKYNVDFVGFPDDNFAVRVDRCQALPEAFEGLNIRWGTHTRLDESDMQRLIPMSKSGCIYIGFGAESAAEKTLQRMKKGGFILRKGLVKINGFELPRTMVEGVTNCREVGIHSNCTWIMGYPGETLEDLKTSVGFILWQEQLYTQGLTPGSEEYKIALNSVNKKMFTATAYPGTAMYKDPYVKDQLTEHFDIQFGDDGEPVCNEGLKKYIEELDDATKVLTDKNGEPLNFSAMSMEQFLEARHYIDSGRIEKILDMK